MGYGRQYTQGKNIVLYVAIGLQIVAFIFYFTGFASPYWVQSWPRIYSGFKNIGLWEACFAGQVLPFDPREKAYHGCWWILAPEYHDIRGWLMPWWFVLTQILCTLVFILILINMILHLVMWLSSGIIQQTGIAKRAPIKVVQSATIITIVNSLVMIFTVVLFGLGYYLDRNWMPYRQLNYLSWSYGCTIVGTFFLIFASIALIVYNRIVRQEYREPGSMTTPLASSPSSPPLSYTSPGYGGPSPSTSGGYRPPSAPGYIGSTSGGYPPPQPAGGGYPSGSTSGGYPGPNSGYQGSTSGYPGSTSGYPGGSTTGYQPGYQPPPQSTSGYPSGSGQPQYPGAGSTSSYPGQQLYPGSGSTTSYPGSKLV